jgi:glutathione S-transferase
MTIADLLAACDTAHFVEFLNYDISNFSNLYKWYKKMMAIPEVHEVHEAVYALAKKLTNSVVLYGHPASPPCRAVETVMKMAGIQYEYKIVDLFKGE